MEKKSPKLALFKPGSPLIKHTNKNELTNSSPQYPLSHQVKKYQKRGGGEHFTCIRATWLSPVAEIDIGHLPVLDLAGAGSASNGHVRRSDQGPASAMLDRCGPLEFTKRLTALQKRTLSERAD